MLLLTVSHEEKLKVVNLVSNNSLLSDMNLNLPVQFVTIFIGTCLNLSIFKVQ